MLWWSEWESACAVARAQGLVAKIPYREYTKVHDTQKRNGRRGSLMEIMPRPPGWGLSEGVTYAGRGSAGRGAGRGGVGNAGRSHRNERERGHGSECPTSV